MSAPGMDGCSCPGPDTCVGPPCPNAPKPKGPPEAVRKAFDGAMQYVEPNFRDALYASFESALTELVAERDEAKRVLAETEDEWRKQFEGVRAALAAANVHSDIGEFAASLYMGVSNAMVSEGFSCDVVDELRALGAGRNARPRLPRSQSGREHHDVIREAIDYLHGYAMLPTASPPIEGDGQRSDAHASLRVLMAGNVRVTAELVEAKADLDTQEKVTVARARSLDEALRAADELRAALAAVEQVGGLVHVTPEIRAQVRAALSSEGQPGGEKITHGRHCTCSPCAAEDWTQPHLAPCGMHGSACRREYQPWGPAGSVVTDPAWEPSPIDEHMQPTGEQVAKWAADGVA